MILQSYIHSSAIIPQIRYTVNTDNVSSCLLKNEIIEEMSMSSPVFEFIKKEIHNEERKEYVSLLPIMCGSGKSTAIAYLIKDTIEHLNDDNNGGILILTDRKELLSQYTDPGDEELKKYISSNKDKIAIWTYDTGLKKNDIQNCPVLLTTTQRYFMHQKEEIASIFLKWKNGTRKTIIFDEQPFLYSEFDLCLDTIYEFGKSCLRYITNDNYEENLELFHEVHPL